MYKRILLLLLCLLTALPALAEEEVLIVPAEILPISEDLLTLQTACML